MAGITAPNPIRFCASLNLRRIRSKEHQLEVPERRRRRQPSLNCFFFRLAFVCLCVCFFEVTVGFKGVSLDEWFTIIRQSVYNIPPECLYRRISPLVFSYVDINDDAVNFEKE